MQDLDCRPNDSLVSDPLSAAGIFPGARTPPSGANSQTSNSNLPNLVLASKFNSILYFR